jgi:membrane protein DedA with SNARE-associated domain
VVSFFESLIQTWGVWGFFAGIVLEEIIVPLPSSLIMMAGGFFLIQGQTFSQVLPEVFLKLVVPGALGVTLGSLFFYFLSFYGGDLALKKIGPKFGLSNKETDNIQAYFQKKRLDEIALLLLRALPIFPGIAVSIMAGLLKMPLINFLIVSFAGSALRVLAMGLLGWQAKEAYFILALKFESLSNWVFLGFVLCVILAYLLLKKKLNTRY